MLTDYYTHKGHGINYRNSLCGMSYSFNMGDSVFRSSSKDEDGSSVEFHFISASIHHNSIGEDSESRILRLIMGPLCILLGWKYRGNDL